MADVWFESIIKRWEEFENLLKTLNNSSHSLEVSS